jgi:hypothetical protein
MAAKYGVTEAQPFAVGVQNGYAVLPKSLNQIDAWQPPDQGSQIDDADIAPLKQWIVEKVSLGPGDPSTAA